VASNQVSPRVARFFTEHNPQTPVLVLDLAVVAQRYREICDAMPFAVPYYAAKANPEPRIIRLLAELGASFDVASPAEIDLCLSQGATPESLSYGNTIKKGVDIAYAYDKGVRLFAFDNISELKKLAQEAPGARVLCRLLVNGTGAQWLPSHKFGCPPECAVDLLKHAATRGLNPHGLCFHVGSQQTDPSRWEAAIVSAAEIFAKLRMSGIDLEMLNIGGGYPARYAENISPISHYGEVIGAALDRCFGMGTAPRIVSEPGRYLVADAGVLRTQVISVRRPLDGGDCWVYLDVGKFSGLTETWGEAIRYRIATSHSGPTTPVVLAGPTCDSQDIIYQQTKYTLPLALDVGDTVDFLSAGAYTASYSSVGFNGFPPLPTYCIGEES